MVVPQDKRFSIFQAWRALASMRLGLVLMFLLAGTASLGVLLPQGAINQQDILSKVKFLLGIDQIFYTWWFKILVCLLGLNVLACLFSRIGAVFHVLRHPRMQVNAFERLQFNDSFTLKTGIQEAVESVSQALLSSRYRVLQRFDEDQVFFYGDKHRLAILGPIIAHLGTLVLIGGVIWGSFSAYEGEVSAVPGVPVPLNKIAVRKTENLIDPNLSIKVNTATVSDPKGNVSFVEDGSDVLTGDIGFNSPLKYKDISAHVIKFDHGMQVNINFQGQIITEYLTTSGPPFTRLPGMVLLWSNINPRPNNPTVDFALAEDSNLIQQDHLGIGSLANPKDQLTISIDGYRAITTLRVVRNPGLGLILLGSLLLVLAMFLALILSYRKVWISLVSEGEQVLVSAGGYGRLKVDFGVEFAALVEEIKVSPGG